jgi:hypothetical protein
MKQKSKISSSFNLLHFPSSARALLYALGMLGAWLCPAELF